MKPPKELGEIESGKVNFTFEEAAELARYIKHLESLLTQPQQGKTAEEGARFLRWIISDGKIEVLSGDAIEVHGIGNPESGMCPVLSAEELYRYWKDEVNKSAGQSRGVRKEDDLLRETAMRCNLAFPQSEQDEKWFEEKCDVTYSGDFINRLYKALDLGDTDENIERFKEALK